MAHPSEEKQTQVSENCTDDATDDSQHLPDVLGEDEQAEVVDLPRQSSSTRQGTAKPVVNVGKGSLRVPDVLLND